MVDNYKQQGLESLTAFGDNKEESDKEIIGSEVELKTPTHLSKPLSDSETSSYNNEKESVNSDLERANAWRAQNRFYTIWLPIFSGLFLAIFALVGGMILSKYFDFTDRISKIEEQVKQMRQIDDIKKEIKAEMQKTDTVPIMPQNTVSQ